MKTVKRIIAIVFLLLVIWLIGYLCLTGSRLFSNNSNEDALKSTFYQYNNKEYFLEISDTLEGKIYTQGVGKILVYDSFEDGIVKYMDGETPYYFATVPEGLFDLQLRVVLEVIEWTEH